MKNEGGVGRPVGKLIPTFFGVSKAFMSNFNYDGKHEVIKRQKYVIRFFIRHVDTLENCSNL